MADTETFQSIHRSPAAFARLNRRKAADRRLRFYGMAAIALAAAALVVLLWSVFEKAFGALTEHTLVIERTLPAAIIDPEGNRDAAALRGADYLSLMRDWLKEEVPSATGRTDRRVLYELISGGASYALRDQVMAGAVPLDEPVTHRILMSDDADLYLKGYFGAPVSLDVTGEAAIDGVEGSVALTSTSDDFAPVMAMVRGHLEEQARALRADAVRQQRGIDVVGGQLADVAGEVREALEKRIEVYTAKRDNLLARAAGLEARAAATSGSEKLTKEMPSVLLRVNGGWIKAQSVSSSRIEGKTLVPLAGAEATRDWRLYRVDKPEVGRRIKDNQIAWLETLRDEGKIESSFNSRLFTDGDSREAELAGVWGAVVGSFWTMLVTFCVSFPIGVGAAIYLEEFAAKNRLTNLIEININNLAAVPSIVFGLLGLAVFLNFFGVPRSSPLAGGLVLALMTLPTIIIASRAAIRAVPPSIRDAALGVGASRVQTTFHHVLPLAMPGILTGSIIGMAQALGETAPLLMIGMVAFIVDIPGGVTEAASVLPVQIYRWADFPERAFEMRTSAAIVVLLGFLVIMNALAILLRRRFERRW